MSVTLIVKCKKHPRYTGRYRPRAACRACDAVYWIEQAPFTGGDCERVADCLADGTLSVKTETTS